MKKRHSYYTEINPRSKFVYCRDSGGSYTTYDELFDAYPEITKYKDKYTNKPLEKGIVYKVITEVPHQDQLCNIFVLERYGEIYLCTNDDHSLAPINVNSPFVSDKTIKRILEAIKEVDEMYPFIDFSCSMIMERTLCISFYNHNCIFGKYNKYIPNVAKMSTKDITKRIKKFVEEGFKYE